MKNKTIATIILVIGSLALLSSLANIWDDGMVRTYDINGLLIGAGFVALAFFFFKKDR